MEKIASIGLDLRIDEIKYIPLITDSNISLSDYDIVLLELSVLRSCGFNSIEKHKAYNLTSENLTLIKHSAAHWKKELRNFLLNGGVLIVNLCEVEYYYIMSYSPNNNYSDFFPFEKGFQNLSGNDIIPKDSSIKDLFGSFRDKISYKVYLENFSCQDKVIFNNRTNDKALGITQNVGTKGGYVIYLPYINFTPEDHGSIKKFIQCIIAINKRNKDIEGKTPPPEWAESPLFNLEEAEQTKTEIKVNINKIKKLEQENELLSEKLEEQEILKGLLYETGTPLEKSVRKALRILGYQAEGFNNGELEIDQVIISPEGYRFIGECEGKETKPITIEKLNQLLRAIQDDYARDDIKLDEKAYGLLIGNPFRLVNPQERTNPPFTDKCLSTANHSKIGLITSESLFYVARYIQESNDIEFAKRCRDAIFDQLGEIIKFPDIPS